MPNGNREFEDFARSAAICVKKADMEKLKQILFSSEVYSLDWDQEHFSDRMFDLLIMLATAPEFLNSQDTDFYYVYFIAYIDKLTSTQISKLLKTISATYHLIRDVACCHAMADLVGTVSPNQAGMVLLSSLARTPNAYRREFVVIGFYRIYENCTELQLRRRVVVELERLTKDANAGVVAAARRTLQRCARSA